MKQRLSPTRDAIQAQLNVKRGKFNLDIKLDLPGTGISALFGPSGSGKTTCLRALAGLERLPASKVQIGDTIWQDEEKGIFVPPHQRDIGYVFQEASLFPHLDVQQNILFGFQRVPVERRKIMPNEVVELLNIADLLARMPAMLSGGERQRVAIARALLTSPRLLLMDEPLSALDAKLKQEILPYLERLHEHLSMPIVYVSHSPAEVARLADHLCLIDKGELLTEGATADVMLSQHASALFIDGPSTLWQGKVKQHHAQLTDVQVGQQTLRLTERAFALDQAIRCRIFASDVSLSLSQPIDSSILNSFEGVVKTIEKTDRASEVLVTLALQTTLLLQAQISVYSQQRLNIHIGQQLWAQVKSVAVL